MRKPLPDYKLRLPQELKDRIAKAADDNNRSMNAEMVARLDASFRGEGESAPIVSVLETLPAQVQALESKLNAIPADQLQAFSELMQGLKRGEIVSRLVESFAGAIDLNDIAISRRAMRTPAADDYIKRIDLLEERLDEARVPDFITGSRIDALSEEVEKLRKQVKELAAMVRKQGAP